jgi:superfamily II DNA or RNA helicase
MDNSQDFDKLLCNIDQDEAYKVLDRIYSDGGINNSIRFSKEIDDILLSHQKMHVFNLISALKDSRNSAILDGSYTGTGKTYSTAAVCKETKRRPFVICLKSNISTWERVLKLFDVDPIAVVNYDMIRTGKYYVDGDAVDCPYLVKDKTRFRWDFAEIGKRNMVMVFDEVHVCKNKGTLNSKLLMSCKSIKTIMLSATLCDKITDFGVFGMMLGFYSSVAVGKNWMENVIRREKCRMETRSDSDTLGFNILHREIFNAKGSRMSLEDIGDDMSKDQIMVECFTVSKNVKELVDKLYEGISIQKDKLQYGVTENNETKKASALREIAFKREKIENLKADIMFEQAHSYYESNMSIVIFVNYRSTHSKICDAFKKQLIEYVDIHGGQSLTERGNAIDMFQRNEVRIMISMTQAGGSSISLHDTAGSFPRVSIISPSYSMIELVQVLGRIKRSGGKSHTIQKIVYCSGTCEEHIAKTMRQKEEIIGLMTGEKSTKVMKTAKEPIKNKRSLKFDSNDDDEDKFDVPDVKTFNPSGRMMTGSRIAKIIRNLPQ